MDLIKQLRDRVQEVNEGLSSGLFIKRIVQENEAFIVDMNTEDQLYEKGVNNLGVSIDDFAPYANLTIEIKEVKGQPTDRVTLRDEGDFHSSFFLDIGDTQFEVKASDPKTGKLIKKYGRQILGLTQENIQELIDYYIKPGLEKDIKSLLYGTK